MLAISDTCLSPSHSQVRHDISHTQHTNDLRHARDNHEVIRHGEHIVHGELGKPGVKVGVELVHEIHQLKNQNIMRRNQRKEQTSDGEQSLVRSLKSQISP